MRVPPLQSYRRKRNLGLKETWDVVVPKQNNDPCQDRINGDSKEKATRVATLARTSFHREMATTLSCVADGGFIVVTVVRQECHHETKDHRFLCSSEVPRPWFPCEYVDCHLPSACASLSRVDASGGASVESVAYGCGDQIA